MGLTAAVVMVFIAAVLDLVAFTKSNDESKLARILLSPKLVTPGTATDGMPMSLGPQLAKIDGVKVVQRKFVVPARDEGGATYLVNGEDDTGPELNKDIYPVDQAMIDAWKKERTGAIVTETTARELRLEVGKTVEVGMPTGRLQIKVIGISRNALFTQIIGVHLDYLQEFTKNLDTCGYRVFTAPADFDRVSSEIAKLTKNSSMPVQGISSTRYLASKAKHASTIPVVLGFLGMFLVLTTALTLASNAAISIRERRVEIATLRTLGFYPRTILRLLVSEAVLVGLIGGAVAMLIIWFVFRNGVQLTPRGMLPPTTIGRVAVLCGLAISIVVPLFGSIPSARRSVRMPLVDGLRDSA